MEKGINERIVNQIRSGVDFRVQHPDLQVAATQRQDHAIILI
jgi:hypothetical protein